MKVSVRVAAEVDEVKISLAITNLVENGIKYNKEAWLGARNTQCRSPVLLH